jgi:type I restriction enzyme, S subunit
MTVKASVQTAREEDTTPDDLPEGWALPFLGSLLTINYGKGLKESLRKPGHVPVYGSNGIVGQHDKPLTSGPTIIIGRKGTVGAVHFSPRSCWPIDTTYFIDEFRSADPEYLVYGLRTLGLEEHDTSTAIPGLNRDNLYAQQLPMAPRAEQDRIVTKIEELLERVNASRDRLAKAPKILKAFRQSVLAAACSGRLTEDWRQDNTVSGPDLNSVVLEYHRRSWEEKQSLRMAGKEPKSDTRKALYSSPDFLPYGEAEELPIAWAWIPLGLLGEDPLNTVQTGPFGAQLHRDEFTQRGVPVVAVGNLTGMGFTEEGLYYITGSKAEQLSRFDVQAGDVLFARSGATLGKVCLVPDYVKDWRMTGHILRVRLNTKIVLPRYAVYALHGDPRVTEQVFGNIRGVTRPGFNTNLLEGVRLPLPPIDEQREIVRRVDILFKLADKIETRVEAATNRADKLTQAILAKAFRGELVPTEAELARKEGRDYEPASVLLERIKAEREKAAAGTSNGTGPRRRAAKSGKD